MAATALLAALLAGPLARRIIRPILELDLSRPDQCQCYEELTPLLSRLRTQQETIRAQTDELRQRREEFTAITENMSEGFLLIDRRMNLLSCNASALRLLGAPEAEPGESVLGLSRAEDFRRTVEGALSGRHGEALLEGEGVCCQLLASPVSHQGRPAGAVVAILDVTERQRREALRREFTANVSHELKTPLTSISGFAELMKGGLVPQETVPEFASDIYREAQRLIALFEAENWTDYAIKVHALKSTALTIGAEALSGQAKELELAGKEKKVEFIRKNHPLLLQKYEEICESIAKNLS